MILMQGCRAALVAFFAAVVMISSAGGVVAQAAPEEQPPSYQRSPNTNLSPSASPVPSQPYLAGYGDVLTMVFSNAFASTVRVRMLAMPGFENESMVGIKENLGEFTVFFEQSGKRLWGYSLLEMFKSGAIVATGNDGRNRNAEEVATLSAELPSNIRDVGLSRCEAQIDANLAQEIINVWSTMLARTAPGGSDMGLDGDEYYFSASGRAGTTWSPPADSNNGMLVEIGNEMRKYCRQFALLRGLNGALLRQKVDALSIRLKR